MLGYTLIKTDELNRLKDELQRCNERIQRMENCYTGMAMKFSMISHVMNLKPYQAQHVFNQITDILKEAECQ